MKRRIKSYFTITKKEWNGLVVLVILIVAVLAAPYIFQLFRKDSVINFKDFDKAVAQLSMAEKNGAYGDSANNMQLKHPAMFLFDPNSLSAGQWKQLGLSQRQAEVIIRYEAKGGRFYRKEDLKKIYTISAHDYNRLEPYIDIPGSAGVYKKIIPGESIELNSADSARLTELNGIGPSFAVRIIRYRDRLGGFYRKEQLKEIYDVDSLQYGAINAEVSVNPRLVKKIGINTISFDQLRLFPYLTYKQANAVIQYRVQHGNYKSIEDMKNIAILDERTLQKTAPYLSFK
jgi:DNA uptake protein ComE-like DNA-binding protein